jgi:hypothetical protein
MSLVATILQDAILMVGEGKFGSFENRLSEYGALRAFNDNAPRLLPESAVVQMKKSVRQPEKLPVLNKYDATVITAPSCNPTGSAQTSAFKTLTWAFVGFETKIIPSDNEDNYITETEAFAQQLAMGWKAVFANLDTKAVTALETNKSTGLVTSTNDKVTTEAGDYAYAGIAEEMFLSVPGLMMLNDNNGPWNDIASTESLSTLKKIEAFGENNYYNLKADGTPDGVKLQGDYKHFLTNRIIPAGGDLETHYLAPDGTIGVYNWIDSDSRKGRVAGNKEWGHFQDPMFGFDWSYFKVKDCYDASGTNGNARAYGEIGQVGAWFAFVTEYSSDTTSPIIKLVRRAQA